MNKDILDVENDMLYCSRKCAITNGADPKFLLELHDQDWDECCTDWGQLCPWCEEYYNFTENL